MKRESTQDGLVLSDDLAMDDDDGRSTDGYEVPSKKRKAPGDTVSAQPVAIAPSAPAATLPLGSHHPPNGSQAVVPIVEVEGTRAFRRLRSLYVEDMQRAKAVFICAEPGMGKTLVATRFLDGLRRQGVPIQSVSYRDAESSRATSRLKRLARSYAKVPRTGVTREVVLIDDFPPTDECDLDGQRRAIERMVARDVFVIICMRPEAMQLSEEMPTAGMLATEDLMGLDMQDVPVLAPSLEAMTRAIPALLAPLGGMSLGTAERQAGMEGSDYAKALGLAVSLAVRDALPVEEQRLRLAMLLLGKGDLDMLQMLVGRVDEESLGWLARDAVLLGIDVHAGTFCCAGEGAPCAPGVLARVLGPACALMPDIADRCVRSLAAQGSCHRAAVLTQLCASQGRHEVVSSWGTELVCAGESWLVGQEFGEGLVSQDKALSERLAGWSLRQLNCPAKDLSDAIPGAGKLESPTRTMAMQVRHAELLQAGRDVLRGILPGRRAARRDDDDDLSSLLVDHVEALGLLLGGSFHDAYGLLLNNSARLRPTSLPAALLCGDYAIAALMVGEPPTREDEEALFAARSLCERAGHDSLACYLSMAEPVAMALAGRLERIEGVELAISRADRMGDRAIQAVLLMAAAVTDNRTGAFARAHVRAAQAASLVRGAAGRAIGEAASLVGALSSLSLGDPDPVAGISARLSGTMAGRLVRLFADGWDESSRDVSQSAERPINLAWLLNMLGNDFGERSRAFREAAPKLALSMMRRVVRAADGHARTMEALHDNRALSARQAASWEVPPTAEVPVLKLSERQGARVHISLLGELSILVDGKPIPAAMLERRRARAVVCQLAACRGHRMSRVELVESIWPDVDYDRGMQRVYEATSYARRVLGCRDLGFNPFMRSRGDGSLALDERLVTCDVDQFETLANNALVNGDDDVVVAIASDAMGLYHGDCCAVQHDCLGLYATRTAELRSLLVDVAVMGAGAAMREERTSLAVRMAQAAHEANDMREDAVIALMEALKLAGRASDARDVYSSYACRLLDMTGLPPSQALRRAAGDLFPEQSTQGRKPRRRESHIALC